MLLLCIPVLAASLVVHHLLEDVAGLLVERIEILTELHGAQIPLRETPHTNARIFES